MKLIVCIDNNYGIMFNKRRISRDSKVIEDIINMIDHKTLVCSNYSMSLFKDTNLNIVINDNICNLNNEEFYFLEDQSINNMNIDEVIVYNWNRNYPSDKKLNINLTNYKIIDTYDFIGTSHDKITKIVYKRDDTSCQKEN